MMDDIEAAADVQESQLIPVRHAGGREGDEANSPRLSYRRCVMETTALFCGGNV